MTLLIKYLIIIKRNGFLIWAVCTLILGLLVTFNIFGNIEDLSKKSGIAMTIIGIIAIFIHVFKKEKY